MPQKNKAEREHDYFRVVIVYSDGTTSGNRVFKYRAKTVIEPFCFGNNAEDAEFPAANGVTR